MGVYVHIPFCRRKCFYCGFYSVASSALVDEFVKALEREVSLRKNYLPANVVDTLYFGGGTPSFLDLGHIRRIVAVLEENFDFLPEAERTIEMNPEDGSLEKLEGLKHIGFNRLSIGIQSFSDDVLKRINRSHSAAQAVKAVERAASCGFDNISIDLIIGFPGYGQEGVERDLRMVSQLPVSHVSVYMLSIDSNSVFQKQMEKGLFHPENDDVVADEYSRVVSLLQASGFEHYEISNFARDGRYSCHNTNYWQQKPYLGLGPSAHSYNLDSRQWNVSHIKTYIDSLNNNVLNFDSENLSHNDKYNEYLMTRLRTMWGADLCVLENEFGNCWKSVQGKLNDFLERDLVKIERNQLFMTERGWLISDDLFSDLFVV